MRRVILLLLCLSVLPGCHTLASHTQPKQAADPEKADAIQSMSAAEKEADRQLNKW